MSKNIRTQIGKVIGKTLNSYHTRVKPVIDDIKSAVRVTAVSVDAP